MSYDIMVFSKETGPKRRKEFLKWYEHEMDIGENYDDPKNTTPELRSWFHEMVQTFPTLNGPYSLEEPIEYSSEYSIGKNYIYVCFSWSLEELAYEKTFLLAKKHGVGFFNVSSDQADIFFPENGELTSIERNRKKWWKFW